MDERTIRLLDFTRVLGQMGHHALSEAGASRCLEQRPFVSQEELQRQIQLVRECLSLGKVILDCLQSFPDIEGVFHVLDTDTPLDEDGLWGVGQVLIQASRARSVLSDTDSRKYPSLSFYCESVPWPDKTWQGIARCLDDDGELKDESSPELMQVRTELRRLHSQCTKKVGEFLEQKDVSGYLQNEYLTISSDRYVLAVKSNFKGRLSGIIHDYSQTGETCYFEPLFLVELNNKLQELRQQEREAKRRVLIYLTTLVRQEQDKLRRLYDWLVTLDVLRAKVALARELDCSTMSVQPGAQLCVRRARHPLLLLEKASVEPVDIELEEGQKALIITGGNSGGKTVCLKTLGLLSLMAESAIPVPVAENSSIPWWRGVYVFLGDEQSLEENVSTFTAQIDYLRRVWSELGEESLVLLDEFGAGTDPSQGAALAQAVLDSLLQRRAWVAAATHFPALKAYALSRDDVRAASVLFDARTKTPLYRLAYDQAGSSQALDVAREHGLPEEILERAEQYLLLDGEDTSSLLNRLNDLAWQRDGEIRSLQEHKERLREKERELHRKYEDRIARAIEEVRQYSRDIVQQWRQDRIGRKQAQKHLHSKRQELAEQLSRETEESRAENSDFQTGEKVTYAPWNRIGLIQEKDPKRGSFKIDLGGVNIWATPSELSRAEGNGDSSYTVTRTDKGLGAQLSLDLRGYREEDARLELDRFLDQAVYQGREEAEVIHGRGAGVLRRMVHEQLRRFPGVRSFDVASEDRGGDGVTVVEFG
ncbi:MAG: Smr/MutS family protein [Desulfohalobiaceae bacterium]|nr:Smr/MutS family protein [Desulfohalobiaceae bacterium]